ncbi:MAG: hypothetical protein C0490_26425 [Marivirga sp.]|nr:hypothetical protein [Marivirga sp.]
MIKRTKPHKHDAYFELIYLSEGAGFHWIDTEKYQIHPPVVFFLSGQLHYWEMTAIPKGYVMLFKEEFFDSMKQGDLLNLVRNFEKTGQLHLTSTDGTPFCSPGFMLTMEKTCRFGTSFRRRFSMYFPTIGIPIIFYALLKHPLNRT